MAVELPSSEAEVQTLLESAVTSRASHIRRESQTITMANVRRLLEGDLGLENSALDAYKGLIRQLVDEVLLSSDDVEAQGGEEQAAVSEEIPKETKRLKKNSGKKAVEEKDFEDLQEQDVQREAPKKKKKEKKRRTSSNEEDADGGSNAEMSEEELHVEAPKKKQRKERKEEEINHSKEVDEDGSGSRAVISEDSEEDSDVSEMKKAKKVSPKIASVKPVQNKKIEHLKKIIKACGLTIPPQIYKRAKQQPDDKQDKFLIKELEDMLSRRGLSSNPSDKVFGCVCHGFGGKNPHSWIQVLVLLQRLKLQSRK